MKKIATFCVENSIAFYHARKSPVPSDPFHIHCAYLNADQTEQLIALGKSEGLVVEASNGLIFSEDTAAAKNAAVKKAPAAAEVPAIKTASTSLAAKAARKRGK